jgi:heme-degrading monooxygenase HmoA
MHAVVVEVTLSGQANPAALREQVVPRVSQLPGFVAGYWTRKDNSGLSMVVFDSEEDARAGSDQV